MPDAFMSLFDGATLDGWFAVPRTSDRLWPGGPHARDAAGHADQHESNAAAHPARWEVVDGAIEGYQDPEHPGYGGYLVTEATFGDFELTLEMRHDWPADTGVIVRRRRDSRAGFQVLVDHRKSGSIGGFYGNGTGGFHAVPYTLDAVLSGVQPTALVLEDPATSAEPATADKQGLLSRRGDPGPFLAAWDPAGWNRMRIRCVGEKPVISTWVNEVFVAEIDLSVMNHPGYDADAVAALLGDAGHIALEVHDHDRRFGAARWGPGARCRWRALEIRELPADTTDSPQGPR